MSGSGRAPGRLWTKDFILAFIVNFFIAVVFYLLMTSMALYALDRFQASDSAAGLASSAFVVGSLIARMFAGRLLDVVGRRRMVVASMAAFVAASLLYLPADSLVLLIVLRTLHGMAFGAGTTALAASVQSLIPPERRGEGTGYYGASTTLSTAIGPYLGVVLAGNGGYSGIFYFSLASSVAALLVALMLRLPERPRKPRKPGARRRVPRLRLADMIDPAALPIATVILVGGAVFSGVLSFLTSYAESRGAAGEAGTFFLIYAAAVLASRLFIGRIQDRRGDNAVMYPMIVALGLGLGLLALEPSTLVIALSAVLTGLGFGTLTTSGLAIAVSETPNVRVGTATSTFYLMLDAGTGVGPVVLGLIVPLIGYPGMYGILGAVMLAAVVLYYFVHGRKRRGPRAALG